MTKQRNCLSGNTCHRKSYFRELGPLTWLSLCFLFASDTDKRQRRKKMKLELKMEEEGSPTPDSIWETGDRAEEESIPHDERGDGFSKETKRVREDEDEDEQIHGIPFFLSNRAHTKLCIKIRTRRGRQNEKSTMRPYDFSGQTHTWQT